MPIPTGYPTAATVGVPANVTLTPYTGPTTVNANGVVIDGKTINAATLELNGDNITLRNSRVTFSGFWGVAASGFNCKIENCDIIGPGSSGQSNSGSVGCGTFLNNDISKYENGILLDGANSTIRGNYVHDLLSPGDPHYDGIACHGNVNGALIEHNSIVAHDTSCVFLKNNFGPINNVRVLDNYLAGAVSYNVYVDGRASSSPITNVEIAFNKVEKGVFGYYSVDNATPNIHDNTEVLPGHSWPTTPTEPPPVADTITLVAVTIANQAMGTVSIVNGKLRYTPAVGYSGPANGTYTIRDGAGQESTAAWSGTVSAPPNPPPLAVADQNAFTVPFGTVNVDVDVLANDFADAP